MRNDLNGNTTFTMTRRGFLKTALATSMITLTAGCQLVIEDTRQSGDGATAEGGADEGQPSEGMASVNGTELFYTQLGSGVPIMVMHGGLGLDHAYFRPFMDGLGDVAELTYYDHRGNGRSIAEENWTDVDFATFAADADELRKSLGYDKIIVYGHSYGGFIAQEYAARYQENLSGLILSNTSPNVMDYAPVMPEWATEEAMAAFGQLFAGPFESDEQWGDAWSTAVQLYMKNMDTKIAEDIHNRTHYSAGAWNHAGPLLGSYQMKGRLADIAVPTLVLGGRFDFITPPQAQEDIHAELPDSTITIFDDSAHFPFIAENEAYLNAIRDWVSSL
ncbi:MAG: alpha/beta fold hydrolase [Chloroflexota bacterium]